jgi:NADH-quinone oxidoreductase subunit L/NAD(P)H-quinone oxidoreductase subunit 5
MGEVLLAAIPLAPVLAAAINALAAPRLDERVATLAVTAMAVSFVCAVLLAALVVVQGPVNLALDGWGGPATQRLALGLRADRLAILMALLVTGVSLPVHAFAARALQGDRHQARFFICLNLVSAAVLLVVCSRGLLLLFCFWMAKGYILTHLLAHYRDRPAARRAALKKMTCDLLGNCAFALAVVLIWRTFGSLDLTAIASQAPQHARDHLDLAGLQAGTLTVIALLILVAAMAKSAQVPLHFWLPDTLETPTPVSALMHAGLVNAGGFLLVRLSPLVVLASPALLLAFTVGLLTTLYGTAVMLTRSDIKGALAYSTMGQMGFMVMECGLGAFSVAILHLIAHGIFKATLFLGSGSAIADGKTGRALAGAVPPSGQRPGMPLAAATLSLAVVAPAAICLDPSATRGGAVLLLLFAWASGAQALARVLASGGADALVSRLAFPGLVALGAAYFALVHGLAGFLAPVLPAASSVAAHAPGLSFVLPIMAALLVQAFMLLLGGARPRWLARLGCRLYVLALHRGYGEEIAGLLVVRPLQRRTRL